MICVTVEIVPGGLAPARRTIGSLLISNISDLAPISSYEVVVLEAENPLCGTRSRIANIRVDGHKRAQSVWTLIGAAIASLDAADFVEL
jgi:hypothetical protein